MPNPAVRIATMKDGVMGTTNNGTVKIHIEFARECIKRGYNSELLIWTIARTLDDNGDGAIEAHLLHSAIKTFGYGKAYIRKAINLGFITRRETVRSSDGSDHIEYVIAGTARLASNFGLTHTGKNVVVQYKDLRSVTAFKRSLYASWIGVQQQLGHSKFSRETLVRLWGTSESTLRRWEQQAGVIAIAQYVIADESEVEQSAARNKKKDDAAQYATTESGKAIWQTANEYRYPKAIIASSGYYAQRELERRNGSANQGRSANHERSFYDTRAIQRCGSNWQKMPTPGKKFLVEVDGQRKPGTKLYELVEYKPVPKHLM